ncbi:hypothetical protein TrLO_g13746 [Triparma laevis f. longispina]|uniref:C2 domain-containing protein n=1 Tax=Triparma laevis f. longispina TaxID=1714387 RepID=A0A9W7FQ53_9STRA|nr:hypothetical protein TrLO_g13746 [Triparma laevis f. longispina]
MDAALTTPFFFRQRTGSFDWDKLDRISVDKIIGDIDLDTLQSLLDQVTFCKLNPSISAPRSSNGDSLAIKGMMIQQLIVEYLLNVQESINTSESSLKEELRAAAHHVADLDDQLNRLGARNKSQKRELKMYQAVVKTCENMLTYYGLDSAEIFLAARASATHYGKNPPSPFTQSPPQRQAGLAPALEYLEKEARSAINEVPASSYPDTAGMTKELNGILAKIQNLSALATNNRPVPIVAAPKSGAVADDKGSKTVEEKIEPKIEEPIPAPAADTPITETTPDPPYTTPRPVQPIQKGRFILSAVSADNVKGKDSSLQAYLKVKLGDADIADTKAKAHKTQTTKPAKAGGELDFLNEKITFDLQDPTSITDKDGKVFLEINLYDDNWMSDKCVCTTKLDITDTVTRPYHFGDGPQILEVDMHKPGTSEDCGTLTLKVEFWAARFGAIKLICHEGVNLSNKGNMVDTQDPYVYLTAGEANAQSKTHSNGGTSPKFNGEELLVMVDEKNWTKPCKIQMFDDDFGKDDLIAENTLNLLHMMSSGAPNLTSLAMTNKKQTKTGGTLKCELAFLPFGQLGVIVHSAKALRNPDSWGKPDPYLKITINQGIPTAINAMTDPDMKSKDVKKIVKDAKKATAACAEQITVSKNTQTIDGTLAPEWLAELSFDILDGKTLSLACYDEDVGSDDLIGTAEVDLAEVFQTGKLEQWVSLTYKSKKGEKPAGDVKLQMYFWGPPGVSYPHRPSPMQSRFSDLERVWGAGLTYPPSKAPFDVHDSAAYLSAPGVMEATGIVKVEVVEGSKIKGKDSKLTAYVRAKVGKKGKSFKTKNIKTKSSDGSGTADWSNEALDIPVDDLFKVEEENEVNLYVDLMDDNMLSDTCLGSVIIPLKANYLSNPGVEVEKTYTVSGGKGSGDLKLNVSFLKSKLGALLVTLVDAKNLANRAGIMGSAKNMDPYVQVEVNKAKPGRSKTISNGGKAPSFNNQELLIFCDEKESWKEDVEVTVYDDNIGSDAVIGRNTFSLMDYMNPKDVTDADKEEAVKSFSLLHKGKSAGELRMGTRFLPAGKLTVKCISGRELRNPDSFGKSDPFIEISAGSQMPQLEKKFKTATHSDGGADPQWNFDCEIDVIDQYELSIKCMDKDMIGSDLIGDAELSLLELFKEAAATENNTASVDVWLPLAYSKGKNRLPAGDVHLVLFFVGAQGTEYPLYRPTITGDSAGMDGVDAVGRVQAAGDVLNMTPVGSLEELTKIPASLPDLRRGQLSVTFHEGKNVKGSDSNLQCYAVAKLCNAKKGAFKQQTNTTKKVTEGDPQFTDEKLKFSIIDLAKLKSQSNDGENVTLTVEIFDDNYMSDKSCGKCVINVKDIMLRPNYPWKQDFALDGNGGTISITLCFLASYAGVVKMTLLEGRNLPNKGGMMDTQDPYVYVTVPMGKKDQKVRGLTVDNGGLNPSFGREQLLMWFADEPTDKGVKSWLEPMKIEIYDDDAMADDCIGSCEIDILEYAAIAMGAKSGDGVKEVSEGSKVKEGEEEVDKVIAPVMRSYPLALNGAPGGELIAIVEFEPAATLDIICKGGKNLKNPNMFGKADPYLQFKSESLIKEHGSFDVRCKAHNGGGKTPQWSNEKLTVSVTDHETVEVLCYDDDVGGDDFIGSGKISLTDIYKEGFVNRWIALVDKKKKPAGEVQVSFVARNPEGIAEEVKEKYPLMRPNVESFVIPAVDEGVVGESGGGNPGSPVRTPSKRGVHGGAIMPKRTWKENKGTLRVKVHEVDDIRGKKSKLQLSVRLRLGAETEEFKKTKSRGATEGGLAWEQPDEFEFDCFNPEALVQEDDLVLVVEVTDKVNIMGKKVIIAEKVISVKDALADPGSILRADDGEEGGWFNLNTAGDDDENGRAKLSIWFEEARTGLLVLNLQRCVDLKGPGAMAIFDKKIDPYVKVKVGKTKMKGKTYKDMEQTFEFKESDKLKKLICWCNPSNYFDDIVLQVLDENIGSDGLLGEKVVNLMEIMGKGAAKDKHTYHLGTGKHGKEVFKGHIDIIPSFYAAGTLVVNVLSGKDLRNTEMVGKNDPYVVVEMKGGQGGKEGDDKQQTQTLQGTNDPEWDAELVFEPCDHLEMKFKVMDEDTMSDDLVGEAVYDLSEVYRKGVVDTWINLASGKKNVPSGSIHVVFTFWGSETRFGPLKNEIETKYPCLPVDVNTPQFGDADRINVVEKLSLGGGGGGSLSGDFEAVKQGAAPPVKDKGVSLLKGGDEDGGGGGMAAKKKQNSGSAAPGEEEGKPSAPRVKTALEIKMDKFGETINGLAEEIVVKSNLEAGDKPVLELGARYVHTVDDLELEREESLKALKEKSARFGVGSKGLEEKKLEKKLKVLGTARGDHGPGVVKERGVIKDAVEHAVEEVVGMGGDLGDERVRAEMKEKARGLVMAHKEGEVRESRGDSVHLDQARKQIELAMQDLPKKEDYDHGSPREFEREKGVAGISSIASSVQGLPEKNDFTRRSETIDEGHDSPKTSPRVEEGGEEVVEEEEEKPTVSVDDSWDEAGGGSPMVKVGGNEGFDVDVAMINSPASIASATLEEEEEVGAGGETKVDKELDFSDDDLSEDELP